jgi:hypothetical protein
MPFQTKTSTRENCILEIPSNRTEGILLYHSSDLTKLLLCFGIIDTIDELHSLSEREIGPVDTFGSVEIIWMKDLIEDASLGLRIVVGRERGMVITSLGTIRSTHHAVVGGVMVVMDEAVVVHLGCVLED